MNGLSLARRLAFGLAVLVLLALAPATPALVLAQDSPPAAPSPAPAPEAPAFTVETKTDVVYRTVGETELRLDLYLPVASAADDDENGEGESSDSGADDSGEADANGSAESTHEAPALRPVVLVIHGGGWRMGSKRNMRATAMKLAAHGYVAVAVQYRLVPAGVFPKCVHDIKAAIRWLRANAEIYAIDPTKIGALGLSAGAHLALLVGMTAGHDELTEDGLEEDAPSDALQAVVSYFGPTDFRADPESVPQNARLIVSAFLGGEDPATARLASPITHVDAADPPTLLLHGERDRLVPPAQSQTMYDALQKAEVPSKLLLYPEAGHGFRGATLTEPESPDEAVARFLDRFLKGIVDHDPAFDGAADDGSSGDESEAAPSDDDSTAPDAPGSGDTPESDEDFSFARPLPLAATTTR